MIDTSEVSKMLEGTFWREAKTAPDLGIEWSEEALRQARLGRTLQDCGKPQTIDDCLTLEEVRYLLGDSNED